MVRGSPGESIKRTQSPIRFVSMTASLYGGPEEIRTPDPYNANVMRSQLRYGPVHFAIIPPAPGIVKKKVAGRGGGGFGVFALFFFGNLW